MKTLTIRKIPDKVADAVQQRAEDANLSFSKALLSLLEENLPVKKVKKKRRRDLGYIAGAWSGRDAKEFSESLAEQRKIDPKMWA